MDPAEFSSRHPKSPMLKNLASPGTDQEGHGLITAHYGVEVEVVFTTGKRRMVRVKRISGHGRNRDRSIFRPIPQ